MVALPIVRHGYSIDPAGVIHYDDRPLSWADAEALAGRRLDRRRLYAFIDGELSVCIRWTSGCSGCSNTLEGRGLGCTECGYQGVVRNGAWVPADIAGASA